MRLGFVPLIDAAPLIVAAELGLFADEGLTVTLERQIGWANVRDKLAFGHLDASHALLGMPATSQMGADWFGEPLVSLMTLCLGGDAITLGGDLAGRGINSAATLAKWVLGRLGDRPPVLAHVFPCSMHHYLLRDWLAGAGIDPDLDVRLCVIPPSQMPAHLRAGQLDGFCVGEPWNTAAQADGAGRIVVPTTDILPAHPEKVLAVSARWAAANERTLEPLVRAVLRGCAYCADPANLGALATMLAADRYVAAPAAVLRESLAGDRSFGLAARGSGGGAVRAANWALRSFAPADMFPSRTHPAWLVDQMVRWGHVHPNTDGTEIAEACTDTGPYRRAAEALDVPCPDTDFPPMPLRNGRRYDARAASATASIATVPAAALSA